MNTLIKYILLSCIVTFLFTSCEETIDVSVPTAPPRLVIEGSIDWIKGTTGNDQQIKLSLSTPFFDTDAVTVTNATVQITKENDQSVFIFTHQNEGIYTTDNFIPELNATYTLEVVYDNETYIATETLMPVTDITTVNQTTEAGFDTEIIEINTFFEDPEDETNFYLARYTSTGELLPVFFTQDDEFSNGNEMFFEWENTDEDDNEDSLPGDEIEINLYGISERYYNYIDLLLEQSGDGGGPFSSTPAPLRGNCNNQTDPNNYAFGYFRLNEISQSTYIVQ